MPPSGRWNEGQRRDGDGGGPDADGWPLKKGRTGTLRSSRIERSIAGSRDCGALGPSVRVRATALRVAAILRRQPASLPRRDW